MDLKDIMTQLSNLSQSYCKWLWVLGLSSMTLGLVGRYFSFLPPLSALTLVFIGILPCVVSWGFKKSYPCFWAIDKNIQEISQGLKSLLKSLELRKNLELLIFILSFILSISVVFTQYDLRPVGIPLCFIIGMLYLSTLLFEFQIKVSAHRIIEPK